MVMASAEAGTAKSCIPLVPWSGPKSHEGGLSTRTAWVGARPGTRAGIIGPMVQRLVSARGRDHMVSITVNRQRASRAPKMRPSSRYVRERPEDAVGFRSHLANDDRGWLFSTDEADALSSVVGHRCEIAGHTGHRRREVIA
jgi:hypothetical protein